ncbi:MAG: SulP family inorganic anion transporter [Desulfamplus sp.]|nr:SulP family inorganic anion transporter [Desulfamplus sp.]
MITKIFPFLTWFKGYNLDSFKIDFIAGITVALVLIPQSMAYAQLAGMPSYYGLYAAFLPPMLASLFGSSRQLATGPVAVVSLMTAASLEPLATAGSEGYIAYAILLALMVGVFQLSLGILRLGIVVNFLSHPVVNGFTNAAAIIIASSQLSSMFGVSVDSSEHHYQTIINVCKAAAHYTHWTTFVLGIFAFMVMYILKKFYPKIPNVLVAVAISIIISWAIGFEHNISSPLSAIQSDEVRADIQIFNSLTSELTPLADQRKKTGITMDEAKQVHDPIGVLDAEHDLQVISVKMNKIKHETAVYRKKLRDVFFVAIPEEPNAVDSLKKDDSTNKTGLMTFYIKGTEPVGAKSDGRTWRIKIGNRPIDLNKVTMVGGGAVVGSIPKGIPSFDVPKIDMKVVIKLFPFAAIISLLGFMEAISIAKAMAAKTGQRIDPNQELIGQGVANILGSIGRSYPTSGSFSRSAVNLQAGAITGLSSVFTSLVVVITMLFLTPLLYHLPQSVLASVIMMAVIGLINVSGFVHAWKAQWYDGAISVITFIATLAFAPHLDKGIMVGVVLSLSVFLYKSMRPTVPSLSRHGDEDVFRCAVTHGLKECEYMDLIRFDGPLFFANASYLEDQINDRLLKKPTLKHIVIVSNGINDIDASGEEVISLLVDNIRSSGRDISFSGVNESVYKVFERTHIIAKIGNDHIYPTMAKAVCDIHPVTHTEGQELACPLSRACSLV